MDNITSSDKKIGVETGAGELKPATVEHAPSPEITISEIGKLDQAGLPAPRQVSEPYRPALSAAAEAPKSQLQIEIENVLAEDLEELYWSMSEPERIIFKYKGEEMASKIRIMLAETSLRIREIFNLIVDWLKLLPGVSQFFIEQEAKIKMDKIIKFK